MKIAEFIIGFVIVVSSPSAVSNGLQDSCVSLLENNFELADGGYESSKHMNLTELNSTVNDITYLVERRVGERNYISIARVTDSCGDVIESTTTIMGEPLILSKVDKIVVVGASSHFNVTQSNIFDTQLNLVKDIYHEFSVYQFGTSEDEKVFWLSWEGMEEQNNEWKPYLKYRFYSHDGDFLVENDFFANETFKLERGGVTYRFEIKTPKLPG